MFTDIVGYTRLMGEDGNKALELVRISKQIQKPLVEQFNGDWLKEMGDGVMAKFNSALDAVNCAIQIQRACRADFEAQLRIGIHLGDITIDNNDIYGNGVNVASRLEVLAEPGGILISESIQRAIYGQTGIETEYVDEVKLKNVAYGVKVYAVSGVGLPKAKLPNGGGESAGFKSKTKKLTLNSLLFTVAVAASILALGLFLTNYNRPAKDSDSSAIQLQIKLPEGMYLAANSNYPILAVTPDGNTLIFAAVVNGQRQLYKRNLNSSAIDPIPGTEGAYAPFASGDGSWWGFFRGYKIMKSTFLTGSPIPVATVTPLGVNRGAAWYRDDSLIYSGSANDGLSIRNTLEIKDRSVRDWKLINERRNLPQSWPDVINDSHSVLHTTINSNQIEKADIGLQSLKSRDRKIVINGGSYAKYSDGHILFTREKTLYAISFDANQNLATGQEKLLIKNVMKNRNWSSQFAVGGSTMIYIEAGESEEQEIIAWADREGNIDTVFSNGRPLLNPVLSPDGNAIAIVTLAGSNMDIHQFDINSEIFNRITDHPGEDFCPLWDPNGNNLIFATEIGEDEGEIGPGMAMMPIKSDKPPKRLLKTPELGNWEFPTSWSPEGEWVLFTSVKSKLLGDVEALNLKTNERVLISAEEAVDENAGVFSPDGQWIAYVSNFSGRNEVYVKSFHGSTKPEQVSVSGGYEPLWSKDGEELFYREKDKMMSLTILNKKKMEMSAPKMLFRGPFKENQGGGGRYNYDVSKIGNRFLMIYRHNMPKPEVIKVVLNWKGLLKQ